jgi:Cu/Ag efflux protein CusF
VTVRARSVTLALALALALPLVASAQATQPSATLPTAEGRDRNLKAYVELLRSDVRTQKVAIITQVMALTEAEDKTFWPIYRQYELELSRLNDERLKLIERYAQTYEKLTDAIATELVTKALDIEARRTTLKKNYFDKLKGAMSPITAARALQVENQILLLLDLQIAASLPVARSE